MSAGVLESSNGKPDSSSGLVSVHQTEALPTSLEGLEELLSLLEADLPASPVDPGNARLQSGLQGDLRRYFLALEKAIPMDKIALLYYSQVEG